MIAFLNGILVEKQPTRIVIDVHGVGYEVLIALSSFDKLPEIGTSCRILTVLQVREDARQLFGFFTEEERRLFLQLTAISGIGPKLALAVLSGLSIREFHAAVADGDVKRLSRIQGVGRKTAERMLVELRDRIDPIEAMAARSGETAQALRPDLRDALMALTALGFSPDQAGKMLTRVVNAADAPKETEELVKRALATR